MRPEASLANLQPWQPGNPAPRRSGEVDKALRLARKLTPASIEFCGQVLKDANEDNRVRLKAAEIILLHGMPKGEAAKALIEGDVGAITIHIEHHTSAAPAPADTQPEGPVITIDTTPMGAAE